MNELTPKIKCPHCGAEYLPTEIYIPTDFLPKCKDVTRDEQGVLVAGHVNNMNLHEEYTCDYCGHRFSVDAEVKFVTSATELHDYNFNYESPLYSEDRLELSEK